MKVLGDTAAEESTVPNKDSGAATSEVQGQAAAEALRPGQDS